MSVLLGVFWVGLWLFARWDQRDRIRLIYYKDEQRYRSQAAIERELASGPVKAMADLARDSLLWRQKSVLSGLTSSPYASMKEHDTYNFEESRFLVEEENAKVAGEENDSKSHSFNTIVASFFNVTMPPTSLFSSSHILIRSVDCILLYHPYLCVLADYTLEYTRLMRWVDVGHTVFLNLFINMIVIQCLHGVHTLWLDNVIFKELYILGVALAATLVNSIISSFTIPILSRRPTLESLGLSSDVWMGRRVGRESSSMSSLKELEELSSRTILSDGHSESVRIMAYEDVKSPREESQSLLQRVRQYLCDDVESTLYDDDVVDVKREAKVHSIISALGLYPNGDLAPLTLFQRMKFRSPTNRILSKIQQSRRAAKEIHCHLQGFDADESEFRDAALMQHFILEQIPSLCRYSLRQRFFAFDSNAEQTVHPLVWLLTWLVSLSIISLYIYWAFAFLVMDSNAATIVEYT